MKPAKSHVHAGRIGAGRSPADSAPRSSTPAKGGEPTRTAGEARIAKQVARLLQEASTGSGRASAPVEVPARVIQEVLEQGGGGKAAPPTAAPQAEAPPAGKGESSLEAAVERLLGK